jgi:protein-L-isoaspartate(D-aspartate) O-methyltransferase
MNDQEYLRERLTMVETQIKNRGIQDPRVLLAMSRLPRHLFVPAEIRSSAYDDLALPIRMRQTISQPYIVALMTSLLRLQGDETILEIGTGSGYQAALLACLARKVYTVEYIPELANAARSLLKSLSISNVEVICADGSVGYSPGAPYSGILVTAAAPQVPSVLLDQLIPAGRLVIPVGSRGWEDLELWTHTTGAWQPEIIASVAFVPLRGEAGWPPSAWPEN